MAKKSDGATKPEAPAISAGNLYGYARVSTSEQDLTIQIETLQRAGCRVIRQEKKSGTKRDGRTELATLMEFMQNGDTLVVTRIDRLARSLRDLQNLVHELRAKGVDLRATEQPVDTGTAAGKAFLDMLGVFAEFETNLRRERQMEGITKVMADPALRKLKYGGRPVNMEYRARILELSARGMKRNEIAKEVGVTRQTVWRTLNPKHPEPKERPQ